MVLIFCVNLRGEVSKQKTGKRRKNPFEKLVYECQRFQMRGYLDAKKRSSK